MELKTIPIDKISLEHYNLRFRTMKTELKNLKESIKKHGLLVPLIISEKGNSYELISGHRRLAVLKELGFKKVPSVILDNLPPEDFLVKSLVENIERVDLIPIERGFAYAELNKKLKISIRQIAKMVTRNVAEVSLLIRIIECLNIRIREAFRRGEISYGHAIELIRLKDKNKQLKIFKKLTDENWTIRRTAVEVNLALPQEKLKERERTLNVIEMKVIKKLGDEYGKNVNFQQGQRREKIIIGFDDEQQLKKLLTEIIQSLT